MYRVQFGLSSRKQQLLKGLHVRVANPHARGFTRFRNSLTHALSNRYWRSPMAGSSSRAWHQLLIFFLLLTSSSTWIYTILRSWIIGASVCQRGLCRRVERLRLKCKSAQSVIKVVVLLLDGHWHRTPPCGGLEQWGGNIHLGGSGT